jgi:hypothetical protein
MKRFAVAIVFASLLPLGGCATPYGYSPGAWAYYDDDYDWGQDGYDRPITYYGEVEYGRPYGNAYYAGQPANGAYYSQPAYSYPPAYGPSWYSTYYSGCGCSN